MEMTRESRAVRFLLLLVGIPYSLMGVLAVVAPKTWFDMLKVGALGGYNDHLVRDVGAAFIAFGVLAFVAAFFLDRHVTYVTALTWIVFSVPHFVDHIIERDKLDVLNWIGAMLATGYPVVIGILLMKKAKHLPIQQEQ